MRSPGLLLMLPVRGPRSNTRTASTHPVPATTSTAAAITPIFITMVVRNAIGTLMEASVQLHRFAEVLPPRSSLPVLPHFPFAAPQPSASIQRLTVVAD